MAAPAPAPAAEDVPPPPLPGQFWLKVESPPGAAPGRYHGFYLRQNSVVDPAVMIVTGPPKFLRAHDGKNGGVGLISWKHEGRAFGLVLKAHPAGKAGWERVEIPENETDERLSFVKKDDGSETLEGTCIENWTGWMVCEWSLGHPQLFWTTTALTTLPEFCERVILVREMLA